MNAWLLYRRHSETKIGKKNVIPLLKFQAQIANSLLQAGKVGKHATHGKRDRPSLSSSNQSPVSNTDNPPKHQRSSVAIPQNDIRFDLI